MNRWPMIAAVVLLFGICGCEGLFYDLEEIDAPEQGDDEGECTEDDDCRNTEICDDSECTPVDCETTAECLDILDPTLDYTCEDSTCEIDESEPECTDHNQCDDNERCREQNCERVPCDDVTDCRAAFDSEDYVCDEFCEVDDTEPECFSPTECDELEACIDGECISAAPCNEDDECDDDESCIDGYCIED